MSKRLFVGGLPYSTTNDELQKMFASYGTIVSCNIITDKYSGQSKGFGFIDFDKDEEADKAIAELNGTEVGGRKIVVNVARPMEERSPRPDQRRSFDSRGGHGGGNDRGGRGGYGRGGSR